jgi:hypothetical protein
MSSAARKNLFDGINPFQLQSAISIGILGKRGVESAGASSDSGSCCCTV